MKKFLLVSVLGGILVLTGCSSQDELFEKKKECASYKDKIESEVERKFGKADKYDYVQEIFYSIKSNSCVYTVNETNKWGIYDFLSNEVILEVDSPLKCNCSDTEKEFNKRLKELKGE